MTCVPVDYALPATEHTQRGAAVGDATVRTPPATTQEDAPGADNENTRHRNGYGAARRLDRRVLILGRDWTASRGTFWGKVGSSYGTYGRDML